MDLIVLPADESDMDRLMEIQFSAFEGDPYHHALYPGDEHSPAVRKEAGERTIKELNDDPTIFFIKCVDRQTEIILGYARWNIFERERPKESWAQRPPIDWCTGRQKEIAETFLYASLAMREKIWQGKPHCLLALLCVDPKYQRKGAGTLLVQWGLHKAESLGLPAYLEASPAGLKLYPKLGFHQIDTVIVKAEDSGEEEDKQYIAMLKQYQEASDLHVNGELKGAADQ